MQFGANLIGRYNIKHRNISYRSRYLRFLEQITHPFGYFDPLPRGLRSQSAATAEFPEKKKSRREERRDGKVNAENWTGRRSLLPCPLFVAVRLQALSALVLVHLQTTFLFQIAHGG